MMSIAKARRIHPPSSSSYDKLEELWQDFFSHPSHWWNYTSLKRDPKQPDFKRKSTKEALWIRDWRNPSWIRDKFPSVKGLHLDQPGRANLAESAQASSGYRREERRLMGLCEEGKWREAAEEVGCIIRRRACPSVTVFARLLKECGRSRAPEEGKQIHAHIRACGLASDTRLGNALVNMYAKCGWLVRARSVFDRMLGRNVCSWTVMVSAYVDEGQAEEALVLFEQMRCEGVEPDEFAYLGAIKACAVMRALERGRHIHKLVEVSRVRVRLRGYVETALIDMYAKCGSVNDAQRVFDCMRRRDIAAWSAMIAGYAQCRRGNDALTLFELMQWEAGVVPDAVAFAAALKVCATTRGLDWGRRVHASIEMRGPDLSCGTVLVQSALVDMYSKCGSIGDARRVFDAMPRRNVVSWSAMIAGYTQSGCGSEALALFNRMQLEGQVMPNLVTLATILKACTDLAALEQGRRVHSYIKMRRLEPDAFVGGALIDMYAKCGAIDSARQVFDEMPLHVQDRVLWNAMIAGYAQHGHGKEAIALFEKMQREGVEPDEVTFISLLSACGHEGLVDEARRVFDLMSQEHDITPTTEHCACMVNLLGRSGLLVEAEEFINKMPIQPTDIIWRALLGACRIHDDVELGRRVFQRAFAHSRSQAQSKSVDGGKEKEIMSS